MEKQGNWKQRTLQQDHLGRGSELITKYVSYIENNLSHQTIEWSREKYSANQ